MPQLYVKYCGGCNSTYDRVLFVQQVAEKLQAIIVYDNPDKCNYRLLVQGCHKECVYVENIEKYVIVDKQVDINIIVDALKEQV